MELNEPERIILDRQISWQQAIHEGLYSDLFQADSREPVVQL